jgi:broad specificity phosphatase PhoE
VLLYCVRHGESVYNAEGRIQGQRDIPLSDFGRRQAQAAARALAAAPIEAVYSSPLRRALETAQIIARPHALEVRTDPRLKEIHVGIFQDQRRSDLERLYPKELRRWHSEDLDYAIPGGESRRSLLKRGRAALLDIARAGHQQAVVVSHGRLLVVTIKSLLGIPPRQPPFALENGSITRIEIQPDGAARLVALDDVAHLGDVGLAGSGDL